MNHKCSDWASW